MLQKLKLLLGYEEADTTDDAKLQQIIFSVQDRLKNLLGGIDAPEELDYIVVDVAAARFNRIGSEGLQSHTVEGESLTFTEDEFAAYANDIQAFLDRQQDATRGRVRFL